MYYPHFTRLRFICVTVCQLSAVFTPHFVRWLRGCAFTFCRLFTRVVRAPGCSWTCTFTRARGCTVRPARPAFHMHSSTTRFVAVCVTHKSSLWFRLLVPAAKVRRLLNVPLHAQKAVRCSAAPRCARTARAAPVAVLQFQLPRACARGRRPRSRAGCCCSRVRVCSPVHARSPLPAHVSFSTHSSVRFPAVRRVVSFQPVHPRAIRLCPTFDTSFSARLLTDLLSR